MSDILKQNYFSLFDLPVSFTLDLDELQSRYRQLQRHLHPDRYASANDQERRISVQQTAHLNEAFHSLRDIPRRARYLLELKGISFDDDKDTHFDTAFLMQQMELREELEAIAQANDPLDKISQFLAELEQCRQAMYAELEALFADENSENLEQAKQIVQKVRFLNRLQQEAEEQEEDLLAGV
ncbi:Chaperone protein HscB [hydrothermal vent metagenome]|uniref:Chaperone protein HscB n=1 Tax=hydrothermal vent metagenome TaxID=652676 RepID=A0A3B1BNQ4_9ZZZZ